MGRFCVFFKEQKPVSFQKTKKTDFKTGGLFFF